MTGINPALWLGLAALLQAQPTPDYTIQAIRFGTIPGFPVSGLVVGAPPDERMDVALVVWLIRGGGRTILFDSGFHRQSWIDRFKVTDFVRPDEAVRLAGAEPSEVTDVAISHAHWDHLGGIDLFPGATVWIQRAEFEYYTGAAWQEGVATAASTSRISSRWCAATRQASSGSWTATTARSHRGFASTPGRATPTPRPLQFQRFTTRGRVAKIR